jgi:ankyrin repeat domain-containing protein 50
MLRSAIDSITLDRFLPMLSVVDQEEHKLSIPPLDCDLAKFYWIFKNVDFMEWSSANEPRVLWLSGPPKCSINQAASHIVDQAKNRALDIPRSVLYFFCATSIGTESIITTFVHTILYQIVSSSPMDKKMLIVRKFLFNLLEDILNNKEATNRRLSAFSAEATSDTNIKKILEAPPDGLWAALRAALAVEQSRELSIVIDGLEHVHQSDAFINGVRAFIEHLQQRTSKVKILLTSGPQAHIKEAFDGLPCIEYDQERKGLVAPCI